MSLLPTADDHPSFSSVDGVLFSKDMTRLIVCPGGKTGEYTIPDGVVVIGNNAFQSCLGLDSVIFPEGMSVIENRALESCYFLISVTLPSTVTKIGDGAFAYNLSETFDVFYGGSA